MSVFQSFMTGNRAGQQDADRRTQHRAGSLMAGGDLSGASRTLYEGGDLQGGRAVGTMDRQGQMAPLVRDGKYDEAQAIPGATVEEMGQINAFRASADEAERKQAAQSFELLGSVAAGLRNVPPEQRMAEAQRIAPIIGMDPARITPEMLSDGGLETIIARAMGTAEYLKEERQREKDERDATRPIVTPYGIMLPPSERGPQAGAAPGQPTAAPSPAAPAQTSPQPSGQGFSSYGELQDFVREIVPDARFTSGHRPQSEQDDLVARGVTRATRSAHTYGMGQDLVPSAPRSEWPAIAERLMATGRFRKVLIEDGGPGQGTAPHIHLEPITGSAPAPQPGGQPAAGQTQDVGGGWQLQPMRSPSDERAERSEQRAERAEARSEQANAREQARFDGTAPRPAGKPLPVGIKRLEDADIEIIQAAGTINSNIDRTVAQIQGGQLNLGLGDNLMSEGRNLVGASDQNSRNYASFRANLERMRNDSLRLNKGVQTEGDAVRAWNEILKSMNDEALVLQRLKEVRALNERAIVLRSAQIDQRRADYGAEPIDTSVFATGVPARRDQVAPRSGQQRSAPPQVRNRADYDRLPAGAEYVGPDGKRRRKPAR